MAAEHQEGVGAETAARAGVGHAKDVGEGVPFMDVAEEEEAGADAAREVFDR